MDKASSKYLALCIYLVLALTTFAVFWQAHNHGFVNCDDPDYVLENWHVKAGLARDSIAWAFTTGCAANWHPLTWLSHMLDCQLFGTNPGWHHLTSLLLHIVNTLLLFAVLKQMTGALWRSAFVAAAFALHPLHVESVAWIAERKDVLSALFWMLTMAAYLRYVKRPGISRYLLVLLVFALGLMAKPMLVTLPFVLLLLDYWPLGRFGPGKDVKVGHKTRKSTNTRSQWNLFIRLVCEKLPFFALSAISSVITFLVQQSAGAVKRFDAVPLIIRIANALISYVRYVGKMIWPSRLTALYPYSLDMVSMWQAAAAALLLLAVSIWIIRSARSHKYLLVGWLWYLGTLVPVIGLVQVGNQALADRYTYLPSIGIFVMVAWGAAELLGRWRYRKIGLAISAGLLLVALVICTRIQLHHWRNSITLFERALEVTDDNYIAHFCIAEPLRQQGKIDQAIYHNSEALRIKPDFADAHNNLGYALCQQGKFDEAVKHCTEALRINPGLANAHVNLGMVFLQKGSLDEAITHYAEALRIKPDHPVAHNGLGVALARQDKLDEAVKHYTEALRINPDFADAHINLAAVFLQKGILDEAIIHFRETLRVKPDWAGPMNTLAWLLATETTLRNPEEAIRLAERACELTNYENPSLLDTLAAAYAADGKFAQAIETAEEALESAQSSGQKQLMDEIRNRLRLYKAGQPYIEH